MQNVACVWSLLLLGIAKVVLWEYGVRLSDAERERDEAEVEETTAAANPVGQRQPD